jgi:hypothetical protein
MSYGDCVDVCEDFTPNFGDKRTGCSITTKHCLMLFYQGLFTKNNMTVITYSPYFSLFPQLNIKLKGRHFDTIEVKEGQSQAVLNTLTEHDFQDALKMTEAGSGLLSGRW